MSKLNLTYSLPEETHEARMAFDAPKMASVLFRLDQALRERVKYGPADDGVVCAQLRETLREALDDEGLLYIVTGDA